MTIQLHIHLDGSFRHTTLFELAQDKGEKAILFSFINQNNPFSSRHSTPKWNGNDVRKFHAVIGSCFFYYHLEQNIFIYTRYICIQSACRSLAEFLEKFPFFTPIVAGDSQALERVAYEFVEDQAIQGVLYTETRYNPHYFTADKLTPEQVRIR